MKITKTLVSLGLFVLAASANAANNGVAATIAGPVVLPVNHGQVLCTAAINADGSYASGLELHAATTTKVGVGQYQVGFVATRACATPTAAKGYARWVQVDTLSSGTSANVSCHTADRAGVANAVWVECVNNATGVPQDTSFFLFVAR